MTARTLGIVSLLLALALAVTVTLLVLDAEPAAERGRGVSSPPSESSSDPRVLAALERIEATLRRLEERVARSGSAPAAPARLREPGEPAEPDVASPDPARSELPGAAAELARLEELVAEIGSVLGEHVQASREWRERHRSLGELKASDDGADWEALGELLDLWHRNEAEAKKSAQLMTFRDVLARYGTPTEIWKNDDGAHWVYQRGVDEIYLRFNDGFVTILGVK